MTSLNVEGTAFFGHITKQTTTVFAFLYAKCEFPVVLHESFLDNENNF